MLQISYNIQVRPGAQIYVHKLCSTTGVMMMVIIRMMMMMVMVVMVAVMMMMMMMVMMMMMMMMMMINIVYKCSAFSIIFNKQGIKQ